MKFDFSITHVSLVKNILSHSSKVTNCTINLIFSSQGLKIISSPLPSFSCLYYLKPSIFALYPVKTFLKLENEHYQNVQNSQILSENKKENNFQTEILKRTNIILGGYDFENSIFHTDNNENIIIAMENNCLRSIISSIGYDKNTLKEKIFSYKYEKNKNFSEDEKEQNKKEKIIFENNEINQNCLKLFLNTEEPFLNILFSENKFDIFSRISLFSPDYQVSQNWRNDLSTDSFKKIVKFQILGKVLNCIVKESICEKVSYIRIKTDFFDYNGSREKIIIFFIGDLTIELKEGEDFIIGIEDFEECEFEYILEGLKYSVLNGIEGYERVKVEIYEDGSLLLKVQKEMEMEDVCCYEFLFKACN